MLVGYMRVSSANDRQTTDLQRDALRHAGVDARHLFEDKTSGTRDDRPGLAQALAVCPLGGLPGGVEARPAGPLPLAPDPPRHRAAGTRGGVSVAHRTDGVNRTKVRRVS